MLCVIVARLCVGKHHQTPRYLSLLQQTNLQFSSALNYSLANSTKSLQFFQWLCYAMFGNSIQNKNLTINSHIPDFDKSVKKYTWKRTHGKIEREKNHGKTILGKNDNKQSIRHNSCGMVDKWNVPGMHFLFFVIDKRCYMNRHYCVVLWEIM